MAIIKKIQKNDNSYKMKGGLTFCEAEYNDYYYGDKKYVRIQTFGSSERKERGKQSQVIHLDEETARTLVGYLRESFDI